MRKLYHVPKTICRRLTLKANSGPITMGLVGIGGWGACNATAIMRSKKFNILGVHDAREEVSCRFANRFNTKHYKTYNDLLADPAIQSICITTPNHFHVDFVKKAAEARKHVFVEKPLASHAEDCTLLGACCEKAQVVLQVGHQMRFDPVFREIKRLIKTGSLGKPLFAQGISTLDCCLRNDWRQTLQYCPGQSMEQLGIHLLDILIDLFGTPLTSHGWSRNASPDWCEITLHFAQDLRATVRTSFSSVKHMQLALFFDKGYLTTDGKRLLISSKEKNKKSYCPRGESGSILQFKEFADCIQQGRKPQSGATEAARIMKAVHSMQTIEGSMVS